MIARRRLAAADRLLTVIEEWRLLDGPEAPYPPRWLQRYQRLGGAQCPQTVSELYDAVMDAEEEFLTPGPELLEELLTAG